MSGGLHNPPLGGFIVAATLVVAASDSVDGDRADYECSGAADEVEINLALAAAGANGRVVLLEGTYTIVDPIALTNNNQILEGQGRGTFIDGDGLATTEHGIVISGLTDCTVRNLAIQTQDGGGKTCHCIFIEDGADRFDIDNATIVNSDDEGIHVEGTNIVGGTIQNCTILDADGNGMELVPDGGNNFDYLLICNNKITAVSGSGINFPSVDLCRYCIITDNIIYSLPTLSGMYLRGLYLTVTNNNIYDCAARYGMEVQGDYSVVSGNMLMGNSTGIKCAAVDALTLSNNNCSLNIDEGIELASSCHYVVVENNVCYGNGDEGIKCEADNSIVCGNICSFNGDDGILITRDDNVIIGNNCYNNSQNGAGQDHGIHLEQYADRCMVIGNYCWDDGSNQEDGIHFDDGVTNCQINNNRCYNNMGSGIALMANNDDCQIVGNHCQNNDDYGIEIVAATCDRTYVKNNKLFGNVTGQFLDGGTDTQLAVYAVPFSDGSDPQDSGYEIDANTEMARAWFRLPPEVQQVVRMNVYARSVVTEAHEMELEMVVNGGADNEAYTTHSGSIAALDSISVNFAADDIIFWRNTEAGTLALVGGDSVEVKVLHEVAEGDNCQTDAFFRTVEIEYV